jgi:hypothetical protein
MPTGFRRSRALWDETKRPQASVPSWAYALLSAILYELQPIRFSEIDWSRLTSTARGTVKGLWYALSLLPGLVRVLMKLALHRKWMVAGVVSYYYVVRWIHDLLEAGPVVLMLTSLIAIFTIGLSDDSKPDGLSAYSVFNRGFERLMGSVDAEALLAQHVGLPPGAVIPIAPAEAPQRRQPVPRRDQRRIEEEENTDNENDDNNDAEQPPPPNNNNQARKSGKKARRRNLEQRREIQRQRDAAAGMGMQGGDQEEMMVMQRLIEEQLENENNN